MFPFFRGTGHNTSNPEEFDAGEVRRRWNLKTPPPHQVLSSEDAHRIIDQRKDGNYTGYSYVESIAYKRVDFDVETDDEDSQEKVASTHLEEEDLLSTATKWLSRNWLPLLLLLLTLLSLAVYVIHNKQNNGRDFATAIRQDSFVVRDWINEMRDSLPSPSEFLGSVIGRSKQVVSKIGGHIVSVLHQSKQIGSQIGGHIVSAFKSVLHQASKVGDRIVSAFSSARQQALNNSDQLPILSNPINNMSNEFKGTRDEFTPDCQSFSNDTCPLCEMLVKA